MRHEQAVSPEFDLVGGLTRTSLEKQNSLGIFKTSLDCIESVTFFKSIEQTSQIPVGTLWSHDWMFLNKLEEFLIYSICSGFTFLSDFLRQIRQTLALAASWSMGFLGILITSIFLLMNYSSWIISYAILKGENFAKILDQT